MLNNANKLKTLWVSASFILLLSVSFTDVNAQTNNTPESRVKSFYGWYLKSFVPDPARKKTVLNLSLSTRFHRWYYSKAGQNADYDVFLDGQEWSDAWVDNITMGKAAITGNKAVLKVILRSPPPEELVKTLQIRLIKESGTWKIDYVKALP